MQKRTELLVIEPQLSRPSTIFLPFLLGEKQQQTDPESRRRRVLHLRTPIEFAMGVQEHRVATGERWAAAAHVGTRTVSPPRSADLSPRPERAWSVLRSAPSFRARARV